MMDMRRVNRMKANLEARRDALLQTRLQNVRDESALLSEKEPDLLDTGAERSTATVLSALAASELAEVMRIDAALRRIAEGSWGLCETCSDRIGDSRLEVIPEASRCLECEEGVHPLA